MREAQVQLNKPLRSIDIQILKSWNKCVFVQLADSPHHIGSILNEGNKFLRLHILKRGRGGNIKSA